MKYPLLILLLTLSPLIADQRRESILIDELKIEGYVSLREVLDRLSKSQKLDFDVSFASAELGQNKVPSFALRRVYLGDLLIALGQLSGTEIKMAQKTGATKIQLSVGQAPLVSKTKVPSLSPPAVPQKVVDADALHTQAFPVAHLIGESPRYSDSSEILKTLTSLLKHQARLRGDKMRVEPFKLEQHESTKIILLHAPVAYQITAKAFFDQFAKPKVPPILEESLSKAEGALPSGNEQDEILAILQGMRKELAELREKSQHQENTIRELRKVIDDQKPAKKP